MAAKPHLAAAFAAATFLASPALAQTVGELASVQAETMLVKAKAARAEAYVKLNEATRDGGGDTALTGDLSAPVVRGVYGAGDRLYATFLYANGSSVDARRGDTLPGGYVVSALSATRVELRHRGRTHVIGFSDVRPPSPVRPAAPAPSRTSPADPATPAPLN